MRSSRTTPSPPALPLKQAAASELCLVTAPWIPWERQQLPMVWPHMPTGSSSIMYFKYIPGGILLQIGLKTTRAATPTTATTTAATPVAAAAAAPAAAAAAATATSIICTITTTMTKKMRSYMY